ncbi:hypothetical protein EST92_27350 [Streptomyces sp. TM32]|uniref:hypothetical protein n=1 Tax=Streptomyces sp. TM32 TaxID=1652669 RepID=UPI0010131B29|nr:hypothetical protein [Streptomyces sp. TM32]RXS67875.1 hypothetical protein EST92_27350 [Streptomyces sp. TM32]
MCSEPPEGDAGVVPVRTVHGFDAAIHPYLPMSCLVAVLTSLTARGREVVRMKDLHPELRM